MQDVAKGVQGPIYEVPSGVRTYRKNGAGCGPGARSLCTAISKEFKNSKFNLTFSSAWKGCLSR